MSILSFFTVRDFVTQSYTLRQTICVLHSDLQFNNNFQMCIEVEINFVFVQVKCTLSAVKEKLESQCELSGEKLGETMKACKYLCVCVCA